jgi:hypothetical protein
MAKDNDWDDKAPAPTENPESYEVPANRNAPPTAKNNSMRKNPIRAGTQRGRVFEFIRQNGVNGATDQEGQAVLKIQAGAYAARRQELAGKAKDSEWKYIVESGRTRLTERGNEAIVWVALATPVPVDNKSKSSDRAALKKILRKCMAWCDDVDTSQPIDFICGMRDFVKQHLGEE